ncbi:hypothetical protein NPIL_480381, partial [Nephila pilipes]
CNVILNNNSTSEMLQEIDTPFIKIMTCQDPSDKNASPTFPTDINDENTAL